MAVQPKETDSDDFFVGRLDCVTITGSGGDAVVTMRLEHPDGLRVSAQTILELTHGSNLETARIGNDGK